MSTQAYVFITTSNPGPRLACRQIRRLSGVLRADALFGGPPVVAVVEGADLAAMDAVIDAIVALDSVIDTETHVIRPVEG